MPIRQYDAQLLCDNKLKEHNLYNKGWRTVFTKSEKYIGRCWHDSKRIELSLIHLNTRSEADLYDTVLHEIGHALVGHNEGHNEVWKNKCIEIGLKNPQPCGAYINPDAGRAITVSETKPKRNFHRINKPCPICGVDSVEINSINLSGTRWTKLKCNHLVKHESISPANKQDYSSWTSKSGKVVFPFQVEGIKFAEEAGGRALIADEPGLGKTIQALGFIYFNKELTSPTLWVCKTTLKLQALKEALDWCGPEFMAQIIENPRSFILPNLKLYIISMDLLRNMPTEKIEKINFRTVVADEIQHFKNPDSTRTAELRKLVSKAEYFIPLSGTPWKNRGQEYFPVLNMLDPVRFSSYENFKARWVSYYTDEYGKNRQGGIRNIPAFREYTKDIVIRRMRDDVLPDLPKINRQIRYIDMEALYTKAYDDAETKVANILKAALIDGEDPKNIMAQLMVLKHITGLAKVQVAIEDTVEFLENTDNETEKITLFHHHIDVGDNLQKGDGHSYKGLDNWLVENGFNKSLRLLGGKGPDERNSIIEEFKNNKLNRVLIASTLASGEGLNIQFCQNAMMIERQWNPANEEQAELRFSRPLTFGDYPSYLQEHLFYPDKSPKPTSIRIPYLIADQTVDSMITEIIERKRTEFNRSMNKGMERLEFKENDIMKELADLIIKKRFGGSK